jgi:hypothetical protein
MLRYANVLCVERSACGSLSSTVLATLKSSPAEVDFIIILLVSSSLCLKKLSACAREGICFRLLLLSTTSISFSFVGPSSPPYVIECMHACMRTLQISANLSPVQPAFLHSPHFPDTVIAVTKRPNCQVTDGIIRRNIAKTHFSMSQQTGSFRALES